MNTYDPSQHPRVKSGEFTTKHRDEPESDGLAVAPLTSTPTTDPNGWTQWRTPDGKLHRVDGPAVTSPSGYEVWWQHGERHRVDGPAITRSNGRQEWYLHDKLHREDGPADITSDGSEEWWYEGKRHRTDGPASHLADGTEIWFQHGERHRADGPAVIHPGGRLEWWENDVRKSPEEEAELSAAWNARTPSRHDHLDPSRSPQR